MVWRVGRPSFDSTRVTPSSPLWAITLEGGAEVPGATSRLPIRPIVPLAMKMPLFWLPSGAVPEECTPM